MAWFLWRTLVRSIRRFCLGLIALWVVQQGEGVGSGAGEAVIAGHPLGKGRDQTFAVNGDVEAFLDRGNVWFF